MDRLAEQDLLLKRFPRWTLFLKEEQRRPGHAYLRRVRKECGVEAPHVTSEENLELIALTARYEQILRALWRPFYVDYTWIDRALLISPAYGMREIEYHGTDYIISVRNQLRFELN